MCLSLRFINKPYNLTIYINEKGFQMEAFFCWDDYLIYLLSQVQNR